MPGLERKEPGLDHLVTCSLSMGTAAPATPSPLGCSPDFSDGGPQTLSLRTQMLGEEGLASGCRGGRPGPRQHWAPRPRTHTSLSSAHVGLRPSWEGLSVRPYSRDPGVGCSRPPHCQGNESPQCLCPLSPHRQQAKGGTQLCPQPQPSAPGDLDRTPPVAAATSGCPALAGEYPVERRMGPSVPPIPPRPRGSGVLTKSPGHSLLGVCPITPM